MLQLSDVRDGLKTAQPQFANYYIGKLDQKKEMSLGVYTLNRGGLPVIALGGLQNSSYSIKQVSLLIHWNKSQADTEEAADELFQYLMNAEPGMMGEYKIAFIGMLVPEPQMVGTDDNGVYESVIEFEIYYERKE